MSKKELIPNKLIEAYLDYRRFHYVKIYESLHKNGLIDELRTVKTLDDIMAHRKFLSERKPTLKALLDALVQLEVLQKDQEETYSINKAESGYVSDPKSFQAASGEQAIQQHSDIAELAVRFLEGTVDDIEFSHEFHVFWKALLEAPFYAKGREESVKELAVAGGCVLDMASGQGHALIELSNIVGSNGKVFGIEYSNDHIEISKKLIKETGKSNISVVQGDLNDGLPYKDGQFDGVLFIGAFHFITKREYLINEIARVAKKGAKIAIGNIYSDINTYDRPFMDLIFSMIQPRAVPVDIQSLHDYLSAAGLKIYDSVKVGCNSWYLLEKVQ